MKKYITILQNKKINWKKFFEYSFFASSLIVSISLGVFIVFSLCNKNSDLLKTKTVNGQSSAQENNQEVLGEMTARQEIQEPKEIEIESQPETIVHTRVSEDKSADTLSNEEQEEIKRINEQLERLEKLNKKVKSDYKPSNTVKIDPLKLEPIIAKEIDTTIKTESIDGTIKSTGRPADVCASSAAKFLPECK